MELRGTNSEGKLVKAPVDDLANSLKGKDEEVQLGSSPTHAVYTHRLTGEQRQVDLQEVAQASGLKNVQFHLDIEQAKNSDAYQEKDIDQGIAYNMERIKTDGLRDKFLADKGYKNVYRNGDDYYQWEGGKLSPINNKPGFDVSDLTRMAAHAGRDVGSAIGATAAVGGSSVAAIPSLGTSVVAGVAAAGAAGALGGSVGEQAQRSIDSLVGNDADKYNKKMGVVEELKSRGKDAGMGFIGGAMQPLMTAGVAKVAEGVVGPALEKVAGEWGAKQAAKLLLGATASRMPQGWGMGAASEGAMAAQAMMKEGKEAVASGVLKPGEAGGVIQDAQQALAAGRAKPPAEIAEEAAAQAQMRAQYQSKTLEAAKSRAADELTQKEAEQKAQDQIAKVITTQQQNSKIAFPKHEKELSTLYNSEATQEAALAAQQKVVKDTAGSAAKAWGMKLESDPINGVPTGFEQSSFDAFVGKQQAKVFGGAQGNLSSQRAADLFLDKAAPDALKGETVGALRSVLNNMDIKSGLKEGTKDLLDTIPGHDAGNPQALRDAIDNFHKLAIDSIDSTQLNAKNREALDTVNAALHKLEVGSSSVPDAVQGYYAGYNKLIEVKGLLGKQRGAQTADEYLSMLRGMSDVAKTTWDHKGDSMKDLLHASHMNDILGGSKSQDIKSMLSPEVNLRMDNLEFVSNYVAPQKAGPIVSSGEKPTLLKKVIGAAIGGTTGHIGDHLTGMHGFGAVTGAVRGWNDPVGATHAASAGIKSLLGKAKMVADVAKSGAQAVGGKALDATMSPGGAALRTYAGEQFEEQKLKGGGR